MQFPSKLELIALNEESQNRLLDVTMLSGSEEGGIDDNLASWQITEVTSKQIDIELEFRQPLLVSTDDQPDQIVIQAELSEFQDTNMQSLPTSIVRTKEIPL